MIHRIIRLSAIMAFAFCSCHSGQTSFTITNGSPNYTAVISVEKCKDGVCEGKGIIQLTDKKTKKRVQTLSSDNLYFFLDTNHAPTVNVNELYDEQSPLIFDDFNFDGAEDLAVRNGNESGYGGPSYDVYVYNITKQRFLISKELTALVSNHLGMFQIDRQRKRLITFAKSGCCWRLTMEYSVVPQKGVVKQFELEEDAQDTEMVIVTTRVLSNENWTITTNKYKINDYYKTNAK